MKSIEICSLPALTHCFSRSLTLITRTALSLRHYLVSFSLHGDSIATCSMLRIPFSPHWKRRKGQSLLLMISDQSKLGPLYPARFVLICTRLILNRSRDARPLPRGFTGHVAHPLRSILHRGLHPLFFELLFPLPTERPCRLVISHVLLRGHARNDAAGPVFTKTQSPASLGRFTNGSRPPAVKLAPCEPLSLAGQTCLPEVSCRFATVRDG